MHATPTSTLMRLGVLSCLGLVAACGGGGGGDDSGAAGSPAGSTATALVPQGTPVLFARSTVVQFDQFDTESTSLLQFVPETGVRTTLRFSESFSFARSSLTLHTFDDRLILVRNSGDSSGFGGGTWEDIDLDQNLTGAAFPAVTARSVATNQGSPASRCVAVRGDSIYWLSPESGGGLKTIDFSDAAGSETLLIARSDPESCFQVTLTGVRLRGMETADGVWYSVRFDTASGQMEFFTRDFTSARPSPLASFTPPDHGDFDEAYTFGFDNGLAYWARANATTGMVELWRWGFSGLPERILAATVQGTQVARVAHLDVDDGFAVFAVDDDPPIIDDTRVMLFDPNSQSASVIDLGVRYQQLQIMFRQP